MSPRASLGRPRQPALHLPPEAAPDGKRSRRRESERREQGPQTTDQVTRTERNANTQGEESKTKTDNQMTNGEGRVVREDVALARRQSAITQSAFADQIG
jgi:hypothetical protein